jgi:hypothetical protein
MTFDDDAIVFIEMARRSRSFEVGPSIGVVACHEQAFGLPEAS